MNKDIENFCKKLDFTNGKYSSREIFYELVTLEVHFINAILLNNKQHIQNFNQIMKKYTEQEQHQLCLMLIELTELYSKQKEPIDILGEIYNHLSIRNDKVGQFLTPTHISDMITKVCGIDYNSIKEIGYIPLHEPACGVGGMILSYAREVKANGYDISRNLFVNAWDIDVHCAYMTYIQLALYDIPAIVVNGDTLTLEEKTVLYTPAYYIFNKLKDEGKLTVPFCSWCKREIKEDQVHTSEVEPNNKLCIECYTTEKRLLLLKKLIK